MTRRLHVRLDAELEVIDAAAWYEEQRDGVGDEFLDELDAMLQRIARTPLQFPRIKYDGRRALLHRFPYAVYVLAREELVDVLAVVRQHRDWRTWEQPSSM